MRPVLLVVVLLPAFVLAQRPSQHIDLRGGDPMRQHRTELLQRLGHVWPGTPKGSRGITTPGLRHGDIPWPQQAHARPGMGGAPKDGGQVHRLDSILSVYDGGAYCAAFTYDESGRLIEGIGRDISLNILTGRVLYEYNGAGLNIRSTEYDRDTITDQWVNSQRTEYIYDGSGVLLSAEHSNWNPDIGQWVADGNDVFNYDGNGDLIGIEEQYFNANAGIWENLFRHDLDRGTDGLLLQETQSQWDTMTLAWEPWLRRVYTYDSNGSLVQLMKQCWCAWDEPEPQWRHEFKDDYSYNGNGDITEVFRSRTEWGNPNNPNWYLDSRTQHISDGTVPYNELLLPFTTADNVSWNYNGESQRWFNHKLLEWVFSDYEEATATWVETGGENFFYSLVTLSSVAEQDGLGEWLLYPNPAGEVVQLQGPQTVGVVLTLRDLQGRTVLQRPAVASGPISLAGLSAGLYTYTLQAGGQMRHGKLLKN